MKKLYADFNDIAAAGTLPLTAQGSVASIVALQEPLRVRCAMVRRSGYRMESCG